MIRMAKDAKKEPVQKRQLYGEDGKPKDGRRFCPKCGAGVFLAVHGDRLSCGKCGYTEKKE